jgi:thioredoxin 1
MIVETSETRFRDDVLYAEGVTLVDFWAPDSGKSGVQGPILEEFAADRPDVRVVKVNARRFPRLAGALGVKELPALVVFKDGRPLASMAGVQHRYALGRLVRAAEARADRIPEA